MPSVGRPVEGLSTKFLKRLELPEDPNDCWGWSGYVRSDGYPVLRVKNKEHGSVNIRAHVLALELAGLGRHELVHHDCRNRTCVNPDHLVPMARTEHSKLHSPEKERNAYGVWL